MPTRQCPVCGQKMEPKAPHCPQCGAERALAAHPLLTKWGWLDVLLGTLAGWALLTLTTLLTLHMLDIILFSWVPVAVTGLLLSLGAYLLIRRFYPLMARGFTFAVITFLLFLLSMLWLIQQGMESMARSHGR